MVSFQQQTFIIFGLGKYIHTSVKIESTSVDNIVTIIGMQGRELVQAGTVRVGTVCQKHTNHPISSQASLCECKGMSMQGNE